MACVCFDSISTSVQKSWDFRILG